ncbi:carbonic anhydrase family protein [Microbulbifer pacificus]|uniref:Carbonic anhydrase family protein n=1 Tax=Microbulbifer pacificus TaxID=407164 RepID=A0AAU0MYN9_9GAMM|nr:carbonic anhydrase family protein [Microbulbifer pacificus]WOX05128.1 carbonic anhydrase family protein [Microbulbifer pacificus]
MCNEPERQHHQSDPACSRRNDDDRKKSLVHPGLRQDYSRRQVIKSALTAGIAGMAAGAGLMSFSGVSFAAALTKEQRDALSPDDIIAMMVQGNERFRSGKMQQHDYLAQKRASASGQFPAAAILSCIDSRTPAEILLDMGLGESFNARIAGNICNDHILGSLEFACAAAGAKVILVMGHSACGAVKGAIDGVKLGNLTGLLDEIKPAVAATSYDGDRTSENAEFVDLVATTNVRRAMDEIRDNSEVLANLEKEGKIKIVGAMYHLNGGRLELLD